MGTNRRYYRAKPAEWGLGETQGGKEQVVVRFDIITPGVPEHSMTWFGFFTDATFDRTVESLRHCGWKGDDLSNIEGLDQEVELVIEDEKYEEKTRAKVQWVNRIGGLALKAPLDPDKAKGFAASMRDRIRALDAVNGTRATPRSTAAPRSTSTAKPYSPGRPPEPPPHTDDDMPF